MLTKQQLIILTLSIGLATLFASCNEESPEIGLQFIDDTSFELASIDTITMQMSTILLDSAATSTNGRILIGSFDDPSIGTIKASAYLTSDTFIFRDASDADDLEYLHTEFRITYDGYYYYDTTQLQTFRIYEVLEEIQSDDGLFYNNTEFNSRTTSGNRILLGEISFEAKPNDNDPLEISIDHPIGKEIFDRSFGIIDDDADLFSDVIHGFLIEAAEGNSTILGFRPQFEFIIHYEDKSQIPSVERELIYSFEDGLGKYFTQIKFDSSADLIQNLQLQDSILDTRFSNDIGFIMGSIGLGLRVELPYLRQILEDNPEIAIDDAILSLKPVLNEFKGHRRMPLFLETNLVDRKNQFLGIPGQTGFLIEDDEFDIETQYLINIQDYFDLQLSIEENNNNAILITLPATEAFSSVDQLLVGNGEHNEFKSEILLNLIRLKNE